MTNELLDKSQGQSDHQRLPAKLLSEAEHNATVMLQAADLLRQLGFDDMAIALRVRCEITREVVAQATREESPDPE